MLNNNRLNRLIIENIHNLLTEISIQDKYQKEQNKLNIPFDTFEMLCNLDTTTTPNKVGKYSNWIIAKYNPNINIQELKRCLEWYADGLKRGILKRYNIPNDINQFKSYDDLINTMNGLNENDDTDLSQSEYNQRQKLQGQFDVLGSNNFYEIIQPKTFDAERYFGSGTAWCTVANKSYYNGYMRKGPLYILYPKNGDNNYKMQFHFETKSFADSEDNVDKTPLSCIESVLQDEQMINDLRNLCKKVFNKYSKYFMTIEELHPIIQQRLSNGENPEDIFDRIKMFSNGLAPVRLNDKSNFINTNREIVFNQWFDWVWGFKDGFASVELNKKCNFINTNGEIISDQWFDRVSDFSDGFAMVKLNYKWNFINTKGELISDQWFDWADYFYNGFSRVKLSGKYNFINTDGEITFNQWFDRVSDFYKGFAQVKLNGKDYYLRKDGVLCDYDTHEPLQENKMNKINNINMKQSIKLTESELRNIIKESVKKLLRKSSMANENYHFSDYYNDFDSNDIRQEYPRGKQGDIKYSWDKDKYDEKHSLINKEMKDLANSAGDYRDLNNYWSDRELKQGKKNMNKWVRGEFKNSNQIENELNDF